MKSLFGVDLFANPEALLLLLLIPVYIFWYLRYYRRQRLVIRLSYDPTQLQKPKVNLAFLRFLPRVLQLVSLALMIIAIARPQTANEIIERKTEGIDIMLLLDTSGSMEAEDFTPNRLEVAKQTAVRFIEARKDDRIGMVLFAAEALSFSPLTLDHDLLIQLIESINFNLLPRQGTAIGSAVAVAINRMRDSKNPSRIMVLITDGANNRGEIDPITAARLSAQFGIRIYCIGIGTANQGRVSQSELDEETLKRIAGITGGRFFRVTNSAYFSQVFEEISQLEKTEINETRFREVRDHYPIFIKIAILFLGISFLLMLTFMYNPLEQ